MCRNCWQEDWGSVQVDTPAVREAARRIRDLYEEALAGGLLHVFLDDWNIDCWPHVLEYPGDMSEKEVAVTRRCHEYVQGISVDERVSALALYEGFWGRRDLWDENAHA